MVAEIEIMESKQPDVGPVLEASRPPLGCQASRATSANFSYPRSDYMSASDILKFGMSKLWDIVVDALTKTQCPPHKDQL